MTRLTDEQLADLELHLDDSLQGLPVVVDPGMVRSLVAEVRASRLTAEEREALQQVRRVITKNADIVLDNEDAALNLIDKLLARAIATHASNLADLEQETRRG